MECRVRETEAYGRERIMSVAVNHAVRLELNVRRDVTFKLTLPVTVVFSFSQRKTKRRRSNKEIARVCLLFSC